MDPLVPPAEDGAEDGGGRGVRAESVRKALLAGVGALFMTEEGARRLARDWKLPKEVITFVGQQARGAKDEVLRVFAEEVRRFLESDTIRREFWKALSDGALEVRAEIRVRPDAGRAARPGARVSRRRKSARKARR
ncbi:MAG TPA: hypothetical protein VLT61_15185 [Anaeromyxobacteraceae bacterium]|nr:hypothetical protein [Anaeromyxobacteraceae bacterium]